MAATAQPPGVTHQADVVHQVGVAIGGIVQDAQLPYPYQAMNGREATPSAASSNALWAVGQLVSRADSFFLGMHADLSIYPDAFDRFANNLELLQNTHGQQLAQLTQQLETQARGH
jgi:hypothetical protein